jgi:selenide, water dikinase
MHLVSTGEPYAVGTRNGLTFAGEWVWRWKDWIDRRFMQRFTQLPEMAVAPASRASPLADRLAGRRDP